MIFELWYTLALILLMSIFLVKEWLDTELVLFATLLLLVLGKVVTLKEAFVGFSNEGMLSIGLLFVVAGALNHTGAFSQLNHLIFGNHNASLTKKLVRLLFPVAGISAFMNNTPVVAMLVPAVRAWTEKNRFSLSKFLIPISYASILGGICTLIGTSTNLIVHGLMIEYGMPGMSMFEISWVGVPLTIAGLLFISLVGHRLLPDRKGPTVELGAHTREFVIELKVTRGYPSLGKTIEQAGLRHLQGLFLFQIERQHEIIAPARPDEKILEGDRLFFTGIPKTIMELQKTPGLQLIEDSTFDLKNYSSADIKTYEAVVSVSSPLVGKLVRHSNFREKYDAVIIAIHRNGQRIAMKVGDIELEAGDTLLLLARESFYSRWYHSRDFYLVSSADTGPSRPRWQAYFSLFVLLAMVTLTVMHVVPLVLAASLAATTLVVTRTISPAEAKYMVDWSVLLAIACAFGIAAAIKNSGLAAYLGHGVIVMSKSFGVVGVLAAIFMITSIYTNILTNNAAAALLFPIAMSVAASMHVEARPFAITVAIAASASFATPISYQTNLMVYGPGGYRFKDFLKIGIPLQLLIGALGTAIIYWVYF